MSLITIDVDKCKRDGHCVAVCPVKVLTMKKGETPEVSPNMEAFCIECGHCVAVCPAAALSHRAMAMETCPPLSENDRLSPERVEAFFRARRSIRVYKDEPLDRDTVTRLIEVARYAPTGHNFQPVEWLVVADKAEVHRLAGLVVDWMKGMIKTNPEQAEEWNFKTIVLAWRFGIDVVLRGAPGLIVTHADRHDMSAPTACTIALSYLDLASSSFGLGTCWAGFFDAALASHAPLREALALPDGHAGFGSMMIGKPLHKYHRLPLRRAPKVMWR